MVSNSCIFSLGFATGHLHGRHHGSARAKIVAMARRFGADLLLKGIIILLYDTTYM